MSTVRKPPKLVQFAHIRRQEVEVVNEQLQVSRGGRTETAATYASPESIRMQYPVCGITVLAPEDSLTDDVCRSLAGRRKDFISI